MADVAERRRPRWTLQLGRIAGIDLYVHATFALLLLWIGHSAYAVRGSSRDSMLAMAFVLAIFGIVILHELGHALTARRYGIRTRDIILLPIGGVARLERIPEEPKQELAIAIAGPLVNVVLAAVFGSLVLLTGVPTEMSRTLGHNWIFELFAVNVTLTIFNLVPAFPMDGGRVLRAVLAMNMPYTRATQLAASIGQAMAFLFALIGLFFQPVLLLIAFFVWIGAGQEASAVETRAALRGATVRDAMITRFQALAPSDALQRAVDLVLAGFQSDFPVTVDGRIVGVLTRARMLEALGRAGPEQLVAEVMQSQVPTVPLDRSLEEVLALLQECECRVVAVMDPEGQLVGIVTPDNVMELLMIRSSQAGMR